MILQAFTLFHVAISLVGIVSGFVVMYGMLKAQRLEGWTKLFLVMTVLTSVTGFFFPVRHFMPSHGVGIISLILLPIAIYAHYRGQLRGFWRPTYVVTATMAQYLNVFVLIVQSFAKIPALRSLAPTQSEPPFAMTQLAVLALFIVFGIFAWVKFRVTRAPLQPTLAAA